MQLKIAYRWLLYIWMFCISPPRTTFTTLNIRTTHKHHAPSPHVPLLTTHHHSPPRITTHHTPPLTTHHHPPRAITHHAPSPTTNGITNNPISESLRSLRTWNSSLTNQALITTHNMCLARRTAQRSILYPQLLLRDSICSSIVRQRG